MSDVSPARVPTTVDQINAPLGRTYIPLAAALQFINPAHAAAFLTHLGATPTASPTFTGIVRHEYDGDNGYEVTVSDEGAITFAADGASASFGFNSNVSCPLLDCQAIQVSGYATIQNTLSTPGSFGLLIASTLNNAGGTVTGLRLQLTNAASGPNSRAVSVTVGGSEKFSIGLGGAVTVLGAGNGSNDLLIATPSGNDKYNALAIQGTNGAGGIGTGWLSYSSGGQTMRINPGLEVLTGFGAQTGNYCARFVGGTVAFYCGGASVVVGISTTGQSITGTLSVTGNTTTAGRIGAIRIVTTTYVVVAADHAIVGNAPSTPFAVTLLSASANAGRRFEFKNKGAATMTIDASTSLGQIFDGVASNTVALTTGKGIVVQSDGATWVVVAKC